MTSVEAIDFVFEAVWASPLRTALTGAVRRYARPTDSRAEDAVVLMLGPIDARQLQAATVIVNIHVPHPPRAATVNGRAAELRDVPPEARIAELAELGMQALQTRYDPARGALMELTAQQAATEGDWTVISHRVRVAAKNLR